jgi:bifunctional non-homologous end joining protein LigD
MPRVAFEPSIPTRGTQVPAGPAWIHEIKHDGYRLIVQRDGNRVRLFTRNVSSAPRAKKNPPSVNRRA